MMSRFKIEVTHDGSRMHDYGHGCTVCCVAGWNDSCPMVNLTMSVEELRDLRYLLDRAISAADDAAKS